MKTEVNNSADAITGGGMIVSSAAKPGLERPDRQDHRDDEGDPPAGDAGRRHQADIRARHRQSIGAEQAGDRCRDPVRGDSAADRDHVRAYPVGIGGALVGCDDGGRAHGRRQPLPAANGMISDGSNAKLGGATNGNATSG